MAKHKTAHRKALEAHNKYQRALRDQFVKEELDRRNPPAPKPAPAKAAAPKK